jgi:hypothetical protein
MSDMRVEMVLSALLPFAVDTGEWAVSRLDALSSMKQPPVSITLEAG